MARRLQCNAGLLAFSFCLHIPSAWGSVQIDTQKLAEMQAQIDRCEQALQSCQLQTGAKDPCTRQLEQELQALDEFRAEKAVQDSVQSSRRQLHLALLQLYLSQGANDRAQSWFRAHFSVRPPTDKELFGKGPGISDFVDGQMSELARVAEQRVIFRAPRACMIFVNQTEVDREIDLPLGKYKIYTVNPNIVKASTLKTIEVRKRPTPLELSLSCTTVERKIQPNGETDIKPTTSKLPQKPLSRPVKAKSKLTEVPPSDRDNRRILTHRASKAPQRILPLVYEATGLGVGLLAVAGGSLALSLHGKCKAWVKAADGPVCRDNAAWHTRPQSWVAIGLGSALAITSTVLMLMDHRSVKRASKVTAWKLQFGQFRF